MSLNELGNKQYYSVSEFAELLGVHRNTVRNYALKGMIRFVRAGDRAAIRIPISELDRLAKFNLRKVVQNLKEKDLN